MQQSHVLKRLTAQLGFQKLISENRKMLIQFIIAAFFLSVAIYFFLHQGAEFHNIQSALTNANASWVFLGLAITLIYVLLQALMYVFSFRSLGCKIGFRNAILLFLKRNFISIFLPAGGISSLAFFTKPIERQNISKTQIHIASSIYAIVGIVSVILVAIPSLLYLAITKNLSSGEVYAFTGIVAFVALLYWVFRSAIKGRVVYRIIVRLSPQFASVIEEVQAQSFKVKSFILTIITSVFIEFCGIGHLWIAMKALGFVGSWEAAIIGYIVSILFLLLSPFLRGLGAIELSLAFILTRFGFSTMEAVSITFLYRFFEFWLPLIGGALSFVLVRNSLVLRVVPSLLTFFLGVINIVSAVTPAIPERFALIRDFLPMSAINASVYFTLAAGIFLLATSAFLLKGLRITWNVAMVLAIVSIAANLTKAIDYEEAMFAMLLVLSLWLTRKQYYVRSNPSLRILGAKTALFSAAVVMLYGIVGFYYLDKKHFHHDFSLSQSAYYTVQGFFLQNPPDLIAHDKFARNFLLSINFAGISSMAFLVYTLFRPYVFRDEKEEEAMSRATDMVHRFGNSSLDYFKYSTDKLFYFTTSVDGFIAYRIAGNYAVVLENPVCQSREDMKMAVHEFDRFCYQNGLMPLFYRVPEEYLETYRSIHKKAMLIGQEAVVALDEFTIEGRSRRSMRSAINRMNDAGWSFKVYQPPLKAGLLQKLKAVSDDWLADQGYTEMVFAQGKFSGDTLKNQTVVTIENTEEKVIAFANIIPDYVPGEATYDLIRRTSDAPDDTLEFLLVNLFFHFKDSGYKYVNMGLAPMSGLDRAKDISERTMRFAYEEIRVFSRYKGLRNFKEKFFPEWQNRYLVYEHGYDLLQSPVALSRVFKQ